MSKEIIDVVIIGAGPAGLTAGIYAKRAGSNVLILEAFSPGGNLLNTDSVENYTGFSYITGVELAKKMFEHAQDQEIDFEFAKVTSIENIDETIKTIKTITTGGNKKEYKTYAIIIATGTSPLKLDVPGEDEYFHKGLSYCAICDAPKYKDKTIAIIGGGSSAIEAALYVSGFAEKTYIFQILDKLTSYDKVKQKELENNGRIIIKLNVSVKEIIGDGEKVTNIKIYNNKSNVKETIEVDAIFPHIGQIPNTVYFEKTQLVNEKKYIETDKYMQTKYKGVWAIGDVRNTLLRQISTAVNDGTIAGQFVSSYIREVKNEIEK